MYRVQRVYIKTGQPDDPEDAAVRAWCPLQPQPPFHSRIDGLLWEPTVMRLGWLTQVAARIIDRDVEPEESDRGTAGVRVWGSDSREHSHAPHHGGETPEGDADLEVLVTEVLVVRDPRCSPGQGRVRGSRERVCDRTCRDRIGTSGGPITIPDRILEANVFEFGIAAGVTAAGSDRPTAIRELRRRVRWTRTRRRRRPISEPVVEELTESVSGKSDSA